MAVTPMNRLDGLCKIITATETAFCRKITGGKFTPVSHDIIVDGIDNSRFVRKGIETCTTQGNYVGVDHADVALWFPTDGAATVAAFPDFVFGASQGAVGYDYLLTKGQPGPATISCAAGAVANIDLTMMGVYTRSAAATYDIVYNSTKGHTLRDATVTYADAAHGTISVSITNGLTVEAEVYGDAPTPDHEWEPDGFIVTAGAPTITTVTRNPFFQDAGMNVRVTEAGIAIVIALGNETAGENITFTASGFIRDKNAGFDIPMETGGKVLGFTNVWIPGDGNNYGRIVVT